MILENQSNRDNHTILNSERTIHERENPHFAISDDYHKSLRTQKRFSTLTHEDIKGSSRK